MMLGTMKLLLSSGFLMAPNAMVGWTSANLPTIVPFCKRYCRLPVWRRHSLSVHHCILARLKTPAVGGAPSAWMAAIWGLRTHEAL